MWVPQVPSWEPEDKRQLVGHGVAGQGVLQPAKGAPEGLADLHDHMWLRMEPTAMDGTPNAIARQGRDENQR